MVNKKISFIILTIAFLLSAYSSYSYFSGSDINNILSPIISQISQTSKEQEKIKNKPVDSDEITEPRTEECPINGELLPKSYRDKWEKRRPLGVMIENHVEARPQSGLSQADVVYEAVAEGGITRFMAVFYCRDAATVGPARSARIYFVKTIQEYGNYPLYAHVGGANCDRETGSGCANGAKADALGAISKLGWGTYNDLNQFSVPFPIFWRDYERLPNVATEHTVYTSTPKIWTYAKDKRKLTNIDEEGVPWDETFSKWRFVDDEKLDKRGATAKISFSFWNNLQSDFAVDWNYDKNTNTYSRIDGGKPHSDKNNGKQLTAKNVIIVFADESSANDGYPGGHIIYDLIGSGDALVIQNGKVIKSTWKKADEETRMRFYDENNKEIEIVRGKVFVEILPTGNKVIY